MSEKKLREALEFYACEDNWRDFTPDCWEKVKNVLYRCNKHGYEEAQQALSEAGEPEMLRLLRWLRDTRLMEPKIHRAVIMTITRIENHIEREFGYKLPKEETG